jgi:hypothetical protein
MGHLPIPCVLSWMKQISSLDECKMLHTFNCGVGMVLIVKKDRVHELKALLREAGEGVIYDLRAEILGDPYSKKSPLPSIGNFPCLANSPKLSSY